MTKRSCTKPCTIIISSMKRSMLTSKMTWATQELMSLMQNAWAWYTWQVNFAEDSEVKERTKPYFTCTAICLNDKMSYPVTWHFIGSSRWLRWGRESGFFFITMDFICRKWMRCSVQCVNFPKRPLETSLYELRSLIDLKCL